ncbi:hypothetical protein HDV57DRAFT_302031 [Trichoderma longibrachiatum]
MKPLLLSSHLLFALLVSETWWKWLQPLMDFGRLHRFERGEGKKFLSATTARRGFVLLSFDLFSVFARKITSALFDFAFACFYDIPCAQTAVVTSGLFLSTILTLFVSDDGRFLSAAAGLSTEQRGSACFCGGLALTEVLDRRNNVIFFDETLLYFVLFTRFFISRSVQIVLFSLSSDSIPRELDMPPKQHSGGVDYQRGTESERKQKKRGA